MIQGRSLQNLSAEVQRQAEEKRDFKGDTRLLALRYEEPPPKPIANPQAIAAGNGSLPQLITRSQQALVPTGGALKLEVMDTRSSGIGLTAGHGEVFGLTTHALTQVAGRLKIPMTYVKRLKAEMPDFLCETVNTHFRRQPEERMVRTLDGRARAFLSSSYRVLDNDVVLGTALSVLSERTEEIDIKSCEVTSNKLYLQVVFPGIQGEVAVGEAVSAAILLKNSEIGDGAVWLRPMIHTLVCSNGMTVGRGLGGWHSGGRQKGKEVDVFGEVKYASDTQQSMNKTFLLKLRDALRHAMDQGAFARVCARMSVADQLPIVAQPPAMVETARQQLGLTEPESNDVLTHLIRGGNLSQWGFTSAITRASNDVKNYDRAVELQELAGRVIEMPARSWVEISHSDQPPAVKERAVTETKRILTAAA